MLKGDPKGWMKAAREEVGGPEFTEEEKNLLRAVILQLQKARMYPQKKWQVKANMFRKDGGFDEIILDIKCTTKA